MRKVKVKRLREDFEDSIRGLRGEQRMRKNPVYKKLWRKYKKENLH